MSDYIARLQEALQDAAAREYPPPTLAAGRPSLRSALSRRRGAFARRWSSPLVVLVAIAVSGSAAAAVALVETASGPLTGQAPGLDGELRYDIPLTPDLEPGNAGWCSYPIFALTGTIEAAGAGTCSPAPAPGAAALLGGGEPISNPHGLKLKPRRRALNLVWMVVSSGVAAVRLDPHEAIVPRQDPRLPPGWRAVVAFTSLPLTMLRPVLLNREGHPIPPGEPRATLLESGGVSAVRAYSPGSASPAPCAIDKTRIAGVTAQWEVVATRTPQLGSTVAPDTLFSCARSWFSIAGQSNSPSAAVLLNAQNPRRPAPGLPGLQPTTQPGVFRNATAEILAKRVGVAWLVVQSQSTALATRLLNALHVQGSAVTS